MVYGLWVDAAPYRVSSGYITKDTKVKFVILHLELNFKFLLDRISLFKCLLYNILTNVQRNVGF
jgi:hypothetical protein